MAYIELCIQVMPQKLKYSKNRENHMAVLHSKTSETQEEDSLENTKKKKEKKK